MGAEKMGERADHNQISVTPGADIIPDRREWHGRTSSRDSGFLSANYCLNNSTSQFLAVAELNHHQQRPAFTQRSCFISTASHRCGILRLIGFYHLPYGEC